MGYAIFKNGEMVDSGSAKYESPGKIGKRLAGIFEELPELHDVGLVVTEKVRSSTGHVYLVWSNGTALAKYGPESVLEVSTKNWKRVCDHLYVKGDAADARYLGHFVLTLCLED